MIRCLVSNGHSDTATYAASQALFQLLKLTYHATMQERKEKQCTMQVYFMYTEWVYLGRYKTRRLHEERNKNDRCCATSM
jgi:hypothetical protein